MTQAALTLLGIETSCDETAAAVVRGLPPGPGEILSNIVLSQFDAHRLFGGVVPEIAARAHIDALDAVVTEALKVAGLELGALDAIAATAGPGLIGGVMVGLTTAKGLALGAGKPLVAVNHLEGHALSVRLSADCAFPYLLLLVSGGHCQLVIVEAAGRCRLLGETIDDAAGEAFDKTAKLLGLPYPGGPEIERAAVKGDPDAFAFPRPLLDRPGFDFSFAGLKTAVRVAVERAPAHDAQLAAHVAASFQAAVADCLAARAQAAMQAFASDLGPPGGRRFVVAGGVAANRHLRARLDGVARAQGYELIAPPLPLCTDNAAMIAWAGLEAFAAGRRDSLATEARARWPLT